MQVEIQYIEGCPSLPLALARVRAALAALGMDAEVSTTITAAEPCSQLQKFRRKLRRAARELQK
jgi:hypothetical protein